ncbi:MAG: FHA domain-containing protein [Candidatus Hydrogenedentes bacterium]|nr:FHA domain-containing protein [Candidatus Hydrogenedentota bacterium]
MRKERVVILTGPLQGSSVEIKGKLSIGRNPDNDLQLEDLQISRQHAVIEQKEHATVVKDLGSGNGTWIGDRKIVEYKLSSGNIIRLGTHDLRFESEAVDQGEVQAEATREAERGSSGVKFDNSMGTRYETAKAANVYETFFQSPGAAASDAKLAEIQQRLRAVYSANEIITSERNLSKLFARVMEEIFQLIPAHNGVILLQAPGSDELVTEYVRSGNQNVDVKISSSIVNRAFEHGEAIITFDAADDSRFETGASIISHNIASAMCAPLTCQSERLGVIYVDTRGATNAFVNSDLELLVALAGPAGVAIKNAQYVRMLEKAYEDTLLVLANAIELRDHYTVGHTWRVTNFTIEVARELGWSEEKIKEVRMGGVLHDVGKIAVDDAILRKPDRLTDEEFDKIKVHPEKGAQLLQDVSFLEPLIPYCLYHHERYDGKGYPKGLAGEDIPIEGRALAVGDTFDALTSNRPYRKGLDPEKAIQIIEENKGTQFDPACADALIRCFRNGKIDRILQDYYKSSERSIACPFCSTFIQLNEATTEGAEVSCEVCHRAVQVMRKNDAWFGELVPEARRTSQPRMSYSMTESDRG